MVVLPTRDSNPGVLSGARVPAVGGNQHGRVELAAIVERDDDAVLAAVDRCHARLPQKPAVGASFGASPQGSTQVAVFVHPAERLIVLGLEMQTAGSKSIGHRDLPDRAARLGEMVGNAD